MAPYATSMKLDADAGRPMEVEAMLAEPLRRAERAGVPCPAYPSCTSQLAFLDARIAHGAPGGAGVIRLVAIDVDGTLLTSRHEVTAATAAAIERVRGAGVEVVLTTSRPPRALWPILERTRRSPSPPCSSPPRGR